ncbi:RNA 3'-terminal phosphate cyclase [Marasmius fiardii PR-910]|nr:RNA 3'-terminal phosphate cyclase [Marasmius fiardii PR-910]
MSAFVSRAIIDGSVLEGGGQILRNAIALSGLISKPVTVQNIRAGRQQPGLKNQHRTGLELAAQIASAELVGATNGSSEVHFTSSKTSEAVSSDPIHYDADSVTAGATTLLLQISLPLLLFVSNRRTLTLKGGTNATQAPQVDYTQNVFLPMIRNHFGVSNVELDIKRRGYFPKGGGELFVEIEPVAGPLRNMRCLERGNVRSISGIAHLAGLPNNLGRDMVKGAADKLKEAGYSEVNIEYKREKNEDTVGAGSGIVLWAELDGGGFLGASAVGKKGVHAIKVGEEAAGSLIQQLDAGGCVDEWLQDQLILYMALAEGNSEVLCGRRGLTLHTKTAMWVMEQLTDAKFDIEETPGGQTIIRCKGIGYRISTNQ